MLESERQKKSERFEVLISNGSLLECPLAIQWGSEIQILNGQKEVGLQIVWISNGIWNLEAQLFEIRTYLFVDKTKARAPRSTDIMEVGTNIYLL